MKGFPGILQRWQRGVELYFVFLHHYWLVDLTILDVFEPLAVIIQVDAQIFQSLASESLLDVILIWYKFIPNWFLAIRCSRLILYIFCLRARIGHFSKEPWFLLWEIALLFRAHNPSTMRVEQHLFPPLKIQPNHSRHHHSLKPSWSSPPVSSPSGLHLASRPPPSLCNTHKTFLLNLPGYFHHATWPKTSFCIMKHFMGLFLLPLSQSCPYQLKTKG